MSKMEMRRRLSGLVSKGTELRNEGVYLGPDDDWRGWKERREDFHRRVCDTVAAIDESDVSSARIDPVREMNGPIMRGQLSISQNNPLIADYNNRLVYLLFHDTQLDRISDLIQQHSERYGPIRESTNTRPRAAVKADELEAWIQARVDAGKRANQNEAFAAAKNHFAPRVVDRDNLFRPLYQKLIPIEWKKTGRRILANK